MFWGINYFCPLPHFMKIVHDTLSKSLLVVLSLDSLFGFLFLMSLQRKEHKRTKTNELKKIIEPRNKL